MKRIHGITTGLLCLSLLIAFTYGNSHGVAVENSSAWRFAVISDTQGDGVVQENARCVNKRILGIIAADIVSEKPELVLAAGDMVNGWFRNGNTDYAAQYANWKRAMRPVYAAGIMIYAVRGNHDSGPARLALPPLPAQLEPAPGSLAVLEREYLKAMIEPHIPMNGPDGEKGLTYVQNHKDACFIALDQYSNGQHKVNQEWLDRELSNHAEPHLFVFGHEPAFEANHKDNLSFYPERRDRFWDGIGKAGARLYFCGHDHFYNRALIADRNGNPIRQIIAGTGGGRLKKWSGRYKERQRVSGEYHNERHHGYVLVTVDGPRVRLEWRAIVDVAGPQWRVLDTFSYTIGSARRHP